MRTIAGWLVMAWALDSGLALAAGTDHGATGAAPASRVLFVTVTGSYDDLGAHAFDVIAAEAGAGNATAVAMSTTSTPVKDALQGGDYDQVWIYDLSSGTDNHASYLEDFEAVAGWFLDHPGRHVIADTRFIASYRAGRWPDEGTRLARNYFHNLAARGGGLVLATDHSAFAAGINEVNRAIGLDDFDGFFNLSTVPVDESHPLMSTPDAMGSALWADFTPGLAPSGLQPNGRQLRGIALADGNPDTPLVSTTIGFVQAPLVASAEPATVAFGGTSLLSASGGSGDGDVTFSLSDGAACCALDDDTLTGTGVGTCTVIATKAADATYEEASATVAVTVLGSADLRISNSDGALQSIPGTFVEYGIVVTNAGPLDASGARLWNSVPPGLAAPLWTCTPVSGTTCPTAAGAGGIDELVDLPAGSALLYRVSAEVTAQPGDMLVHTAWVAVPADFVEVDDADNSASDVNAVVAARVFVDGFEAGDPG